MAKISRWLAEALRRERAGRGWSLSKTAEVAGVHRSHLGEIEDGRRAPTVDTLEKLCDAFGIPLSALFAEAERRRDSGAPPDGPTR